MKLLSDNPSMRRLLRRLACVAAVLTAFATTGADVSRRCADPGSDKCPGESPAASGSPVCGLQEGVFLHGSRKGNQIALTFDACPTSGVPAFTPEVVEYLEREHVPATFFVSGLWAESNPGDLRSLGRASFFEIALHGHRHPRLLGASADTIRAEIEDGRAALLRLGATPAPLFRPPYWDRPHGLSAVARQSGVLPIVGDVGLGDPDPNRTSDVMERDAIRWVQAGSVIVLHVNGRGYGTAETVRNLVPLLRARGYRFVRVSDLVQECQVPAAVTKARGANRRLDE